MTKGFDFKQKRKIDMGTNNVITKAVVATSEKKIWPHERAM